MLAKIFTFSHIFHNLSPEFSTADTADRSGSAAIPLGRPDIAGKHVHVVSIILSVVIRNICSMSLTRKIAQNTFIQLGGKGIGTVLGLIAVAMMTRYLGTVGYGQYTTIVTFLQLFGILADFGLTLVTLQMISEPKADSQKVFQNIWTIRIISALLFYGIGPLSVLLFPYEPIVKIGILITSVSFFFISLNQTTLSIFQKNLRMDYVAWAEVLNRIVLVFGIWLVIYLEQGLLWIMAAIILSNIFQFALHYIFSRKYMQYGIRFDMDIWKKVYAKSWPLAITIALNLLYLKTDTILLSILKPQSDVGLYGASYKVIEILTLLPFMFSGLILPILTERWASGGKEKFFDILQRSFDAMSLFVFPMIVGTVILAKPIMVFVAGPEFIQSGVILSILIFAAAVIYYNVLFGHAIIAIDKQKKTIPAYLLTAVLAIIGYFLFIPQYSYIGAASMTVFAETYIAIGVFIVFFQSTKFFPKLTVTLKSLFASIIMALPLYYLASWNLFILIGLGALTYALVIYVIGGVKKELILDIVSLKK